MQSAGVSRAANGPGTTAADKATLRAEAIAAREALAPSNRAAMSDAVARAPLPFLKPAAIVSAWHPVGAELDILPLVERLAAAGHQTALPVVAGFGRPLIFRAWKPGESLEPGARSIPVPPASAPEIVPDILLVPLLAFDRIGHRLGYGAGFYDRTLAALRARRPIVAVGAAFSTQEVDAIPVEPHDAPLDWLLTDRGAVRIGEGARA